jgi:hypothetical protein
MRRENIMASFGLSFVLLSAIGLTGCGASKNQSSNATDQTRRDRVVQDPVKLNERVNAAANGTLRCQFHGECEPALAMISVVTSEGLERCSGFLISPTQVLTNDHCVSKSTAVEMVPNQVSNIPCKNLIFVHFAKTKDSDEAQAVSCATVQARSFERGVGSKDYTLLKLAKPVIDRKPLKLARRGFGAN